MAPHDSRSPEERHPLSPLHWALLLSLLTHGIAALFVAAYGTLPDAGLVLTLPTEVELSLADLPLPGETIEPQFEPQMDSAATEPMAMPVAQDGAAATSGDEPAEKPPKRDMAEGKEASSVDAGVPAAAPTKRSKRKRPRISRTRTPTDADSGVSDEANRVAVTTALPAVGGGAMVSLRADMAALRGSPYAGQVRTLLRGMEDANALLGGSGVDPMADLERLWVASPDLSRSRTVLAGTLATDSEQALNAARALSASRGETPPEVHHENGVRTLPWQTRNEPPRVLALVDGHTFTIARKEDLARVLRMLGGKDGQSNRRRLLHLKPGALAQLDVIGVQHFVQGASGLPVPRILNTHLLTAPQGGLKLDAQALFDSADDAEAMAEHLKDLRQRYGGHALVQLTGLSAAILQTHIEVAGLQLNLNAKLQAGEARRLLAALVDTMPPPRGAPMPRTTMPAPAAPSP